MGRVIETTFTEEDRKIEGSLRPRKMDRYIGQQKIKDSLKISIQAAKQRGESLDHILFYGPPGLGKTTLCGIIAEEMGVSLRITSGPAIEKPGEMAAILNGLKEGDILFVDEIHRLNKQVEEVLYPAMEDFAIDIMIGKGASAKSIRLDLPHFTLVGATTRAAEDHYHELGPGTAGEDRRGGRSGNGKAKPGNSQAGQPHLKAGQGLRPGHGRRGHHK